MDAKQRYLVQTKVRAADAWVAHVKDAFKDRREALDKAIYWENRGFYVRIVTSTVTA